MSGRQRDRSCSVATSHLEVLGEFIRNQRELARLSLRQLAALAQISNPYLSQIERGMYRPSAEVLRALAGPLGVSARTLYTKAGLLEEDERTRGEPNVEEAIRLDAHLDGSQKEALLRMYRVLREAS
jgi:transcriptional regulator with XRE-family HTH domain